MIKLNSWSVFM